MACAQLTRNLDSWARPHLKQWARLWRCRPLASVECAVNARLSVSLGRCRPAARAIELNPRLLSHAWRLRREVLCHEAAHFAVRELHGLAAKPHGAEWRELSGTRRIRAQGGHPCGAARSCRSPELGVRFSQKCAGVRGYRYEHRCPVCQFTRMARRPVGRWRCAACVDAGLDGVLLITPAARGSSTAMTEPRCPFCEPDASRVFYRDPLVTGLWDAFPVSEGHALLVPRRHVAAWFDATREEQDALIRAVDGGARGDRRVASARWLQHRHQRRAGGRTNGIPPPRPRHSAVLRRRAESARRRTPRHPGQGELRGCGPGHARVVRRSPSPTARPRPRGPIPASPDWPSRTCDFGRHRRRVHDVPGPRATRPLPPGRPQPRRPYQVSDRGLPGRDRPRRAAQAARDREQLPAGESTAGSFRRAPAAPFIRRRTSSATEAATA